MLKLLPMTIPSFFRPLSSQWGQNIRVTANNVQDLSGNAIEAGSTMEFSSFIWQEGVVLHKFWQFDETPNLETLQNDPRFPDNPTSVTLSPIGSMAQEDQTKAGGTTETNLWDTLFHQQMVIIFSLPIVMTLQIFTSAQTMTLQTNF